MIAPCAGAGNIQSSSIEFSGRRLILSSPAAANMAPFQLLSFNLRNRVLTLPLRFSILSLGYLFSHCALRRIELVAMTTSSDSPGLSGCSRRGRAHLIVLVLEPCLVIVMECRA